MKRKMKVVVIEKNYAIGLHIIELLKSKGHVLYYDIVKISALGGDELRIMKKTNSEPIIMLNA